MRRLLLAFLLVFFPLQSIWAAATPYCSHEAAPAGAHFGHHAHEHHHADAAPDGDDGVGGGGTSLADMDCHACHGTGSAVFAQPGAPLPAGVATLQVPGAEPSLAAPPAHRPERPNWQPLA